MEITYALQRGPVEELLGYAVCYGFCEVVVKPEKLL